MLATLWSTKPAICSLTLDTSLHRTQLPHRGGFSNGDFAIIVVNDSAATVKQIISNSGYPIGQEEPLGVINADAHPIAWASGDLEITLLYDPYSGNTRTISFAPGYLKLEKTSETEVRLYNYGAPQMSCSAFKERFKDTMR